MFFTYQSTYSQVKLKLYLRQQFAQFGVVDFDAIIEVEGDAHVSVVVDEFFIFFQFQGCLAEGYTNKINKTGDNIVAEVILLQYGDDITNSIYYQISS